MNLWDNGIVSHALSSKRDDRMIYTSSLESLLAIDGAPETASLGLSRARNSVVNGFFIQSSSFRHGSIRKTWNIANTWQMIQLFKDMHQAWQE